eukprot:scaffold6110_cov70-Phaeocystis_antarctica.AAC.6
MEPALAGSPPPSPCSLLCSSSGSAGGSPGPAAPRRSKSSRSPHARKSRCARWRCLPPSDAEANRHHGARLPRSGLRRR